MSYDPIPVSILLGIYFFAASFFWKKLSMAQPWKAIFCLSVIPVFFVAALFNVSLVSIYAPWLIDAAETGRTRGERGGGLFAVVPLSVLAAYIWYWVMYGQGTFSRNE